MNCWKGREDPAPFVAGLPGEVPRFGSLRALYQAMACCTRCDLALDRTRVVPGAGPARARLMLVGEAPGASEDREGRPFVGAGGRLLDRVLGDAGLDRSKIYITNVAACRPPRNRPPKPAEVRAHAPWLEEQLRLVRPEIVGTLGRVPLTWFIPGARITQLTGQPQELEWQGRGLTLVPLFHPAAALRSPDRVPDLAAGMRVIAGLLQGRA